ncbi:MAG: TPM domain-containing protein [Clostridia bacterium]|nr:TPM domain-containing protein [Clostridia bacterium]
MKRFFSLLCIFLICASFAFPCFASDFANPPIIDVARLMKEDEFNELSQKLEKIRQKHDFDVAVVIEEEMSGYSAQSAADDIYDYRHYGYGDDDNGILLYICIDEREYHLTTHGEGEDIFDGDAISELKDKIESHLSDGSYYLAIDAFADFADKQIEKVRNDPTFMLIVIGCALAIPLLIAFVLMKSKLSKMKTAVENNYAANYIKPGSMRLDVSKDLFLYSHITKTPRPKSNSGSHKSSSGRSHGGGGGSF